MGYVIQFEIKPEYFDKWESVLVKNLETREKELVVERPSPRNDVSELLIKCKSGSISISCWNIGGKYSITLTPLETNDRNDFFKLIDLIEDVFVPMKMHQ